MSVRFTEYQRWVCTVLSYMTICRYYVIRNNNGRYAIRKCGKFRIAMYYLIWINSVIKIGYLILTYHGLFVVVHFLDQMSMWDWFLCFSELVQEANMWYRKYPLFELLHANWTVMEQTWSKLDSKRRDMVDKAIWKTCHQLFIMHTIIVFVGCAALMIQFATTPKYVLNTYAVIPWDNSLLRILFATHEYLFMFHVWVHIAYSIVLVEMFAVAYTHIMAALADVLRQLIQEAPLAPPTSIIKSDPFVEVHPFNLSTTSNKGHKFAPDRQLDPDHFASGTGYDIHGLLEAYKRIMLAMKEYNAWVGLLTGGYTMAVCAQFVSDVFMGIQMLKEPDSDFLSVFFFFEDASAGMALMFPMFVLMSRLYPKSQEFLLELKHYINHTTPLRKLLRKEQRTLRIVAAKIGGHSTNPKTVPKSINALFSYYIGAALWQRPEDRRT